MPGGGKKVTDKKKEVMKKQDFPGLPGEIEAKAPVNQTPIIPKEEEPAPS